MENSEIEKAVRDEVKQTFKSYREKAGNFFRDYPKSQSLPSTTAQVHFLIDLYAATGNKEVFSIPLNPDSNEAYKQIGKHRYNYPKIEWVEEHNERVADETEKVTARRKEQTKGHAYDALDYALKGGFLKWPDNVLVDTPFEFDIPKRGKSLGRTVNARMIKTLRGEATQVRKLITKAKAEALILKRAYIYNSSWFKAGEAHEKFKLKNTAVALLEFHELQLQKLINRIAAKL